VLDAIVLGRRSSHQIFHTGLRRGFFSQRDRIKCSFPSACSRWIRTHFIQAWKVSVRHLLVRPAAAAATEMVAVAVAAAAAAVAVAVITAAVAAL
jgi:hypothetical protein